MPPLCRTTEWVPCGPLATDEQRAEAGELTWASHTVGGSACGRCAKDAKLAGVEKLRMCQRCRQAWYCSKECQTAAWESGHRQECIPRGEFEAGDLVRLKRVPEEVQRCVNGV